MLIIRKPESAEAEALYRIEGACFPAAEAASLDAIRHRIEAFEGTFLVLEEDGVPIGFINGCRSAKDRIEDEMFLPTCRNDADGDYVLIFSLTVSPDRRGGGYGRMLMMRLLDDCRAAGVKQAVLTCKEYYVPYYASMGFRNLGMSASTHGGAVWYDMAIDTNVPGDMAEE